MNRLEDEEWHTDKEKEHLSRRRPPASRWAGLRRAGSGRRGKIGMQPIGVHVSISGGFRKAYQRAVDLDCTAMQIFVGNPRGWHDIVPDRDDVKKFREQVGQSKVKCVVAHAIYLINLAAMDDALRKRSINKMISEVKIADQLGADFYVIHPGGKKEQDKEISIQKNSDSLNAIIAKAKPKCQILLEGTAGGTGDVGSTFEELKQIIDGLEDDSQVGICLDTCHMFAAGYDITKQATASKVLRSFDSILGNKRLKVLHVNDSIGELGLHKDRHENIGKGNIGSKGFKIFLNLKPIRNLPLVLETPVREEGDDLRNLKRIRALLSR